MASEMKREDRGGDHQSTFPTVDSPTSSSGAQAEDAALNGPTVEGPMPSPPLQKASVRVSLPLGPRDDTVANAPGEIEGEEMQGDMDKGTVGGKVSYTSAVGRQSTSSGDSPSIDTAPSNGPPFTLPTSQNWEPSRTMTSISPYPNVTPRTINIDSTFPPNPPISMDDGPVYFWRTQDEYGFLAQWYYAPFTYNGEKYETTEKWMMVHKARLFENWSLAKEMLQTGNPRTNKAQGRKVTGFDEEKWSSEKLRIVHEGNYLKFTLSDSAPELQRSLLQTGDRELVEASPLDRIWGIGFDQYTAGSMRHQWGENLLGKVLMGVRQRIRDENARASQSS